MQESADKVVCHLCEQGGEKVVCVRLLGGDVSNLIFSWEFILILYERDFTHIQISHQIKTVLLSSNCFVE